MPKPILITIPHPSFHGGVGNIYKVLKLNESGEISYFYNTQANRSANPVFFLKMLVQFVRAIQSVSVIHLNPSLDKKALIRDGTLLFIAKLFRKKAVVFFHGWDDGLEETLMRSPFSRALLRKVFSQADVFLLLGEIFYRKLQRLGVKANNIHYVPTVADDTFLQRPGEEKPFQNPIRLLFIAGFVPMKGIDIVLKTFQHLKSLNSGFTFTLVMAGDGPDWEKTKQFAKDLGLTDVEFPGYVSNESKHNCFKEADILFFPCISEGLPCVIMEAMLYGLVVVTRPIGGIPTWVKARKNGWLSESTDPKVFAEGILSLAGERELLADISRRNSSVAFENFTPEKLRDTFRGVYSAV